VPVLYVLIVGIEERIRPRRRRDANGAPLTPLSEPVPQTTQTSV